MAYQIYFADLSEENKSLTLTLLRLKAEAGTIEPNEEELLLTLKGPAMPFPVQDLAPIPKRLPSRRRPPGNNNHRSRKPK